VVWQPQGAYSYTENPYSYTETSYSYTEDPYSYTESPYSYTESPYSYTETPYSYTETPYSYTETSYSYTESQYSYTESQYSYTENPYSYTENPYSYTENPYSYTETSYSYTESEYGCAPHGESPNFETFRFFYRLAQYNQNEYKFVSKGAMNVTERRTVLLIDNEPNLLMVNTRILEREGYYVLPARNLREARSLIKDAAFHAAVLDVEMEDGSGLDFCRELRSPDNSPFASVSRRTRIPIVFLASLKGEEYEKAGYEAGADDYITKPYRIERFVKSLNTLIARTAVKSA
jgi:CheY-like chemotaxis protein